MRDREKSGLLSPTAMRIGLLVGVPVAVMLGVKTLAWAAVSKTWNSGEVLKAADLNASLAALDQRITTLESGVGQNIVMVTATAGGVTGGTAIASCPAGYKLTMTSVVDVRLTNGGTGGWPMGTWACGNESGVLVAILSNYATGSDQSLITCQGLCVK